MKKIICVLLMISLIATLFVGCSKPKNAESNISDEIIIIEEEVVYESGTTSDEIDNNTVSSNDASSVEETTASENNSSNQNTTECKHEYAETVEKKAELFNPGVKKYTCAKCSDSYTKEYPIEELKLLAIGNSYSRDSLWELYTVCEQAGIKNISLALMYIGNGSIDQHWERAQKNSSEDYIYYTNNSGEWKTTEGQTLEAALNAEDWDVITLQNSSGNTGQPAAFANVDNMVNYVKGKCPDATILWYMTWAYQRYMTAEGFWNYFREYDYDQLNMYNKIIECVQTQILPNQNIKGVIPVGTAIQNMRTSRLGDTLNEDGVHLTKDVGRYTAAFTWYQYLTGQSVYEIDVKPALSNATQQIDVILEAVKNAINEPYKVTYSTFTQ